MSAFAFVSTTCDPSRFPLRPGTPSVQLDVDQNPDGQSPIADAMPYGCLSAGPEHRLSVATHAGCAWPLHRRPAVTTIEFSV